MQEVKALVRHVDVDEGSILDYLMVDSMPKKVDGTIYQVQSILLSVLGVPRIKLDLNSMFITQSEFVNMTRIVYQPYVFLPGMLRNPGANPGIGNA